MRKITGMDDELGRVEQSIDLVDGGLKGSAHVRIGGFVEANVTVAALKKVQIALAGLAFGSLAKNVRSGNTTGGDGPNHSCTCPGHTPQKTSAVYSIVVMVV